MSIQTKRNLRQSKTYKFIMIALLACLCVASTLICVAVGSVEYTVAQVLEAFRSTAAQARLIVWNVRLPRILCGGIVGICLSLAGCILQGVMRNHLASPSTIGVTSGASFVGYMVLVVLPQYYYMLPVGAIIGSFITTMMIYALAYDRGVSPVKMILSGLAISAVFGAVNDVIKIFFSEHLGDATGFMVGSLNGASWDDFRLVLPYAAAGIIACLFLPEKMNILMLGDEMANTLGLRTESFRLLLIVVSSLLSGAGRIMDGLYMEGPYMNGRGSNQKNIKWQPGQILHEEYEPLLEGLGDLVRIWDIDPDRPGIIPFMQDAKKVNPAAVFALGHSNATMDQCRKVWKYGVKVRTHYSNGGKAKGRCQGSLGAGCDEFAMYTPEMYLELICDQTGVHVTPDLIKTIVRNKGVEKMILITDSMASKERFPNNMEDGIWFGPDLNYDYRGYLCGSRMTLENGCRNMMTHTGYGLCHSIRMATINPARMLGIDDEVGSLEAGKKANLIIIDDAVRVKKVILQGDLMVENGKLL